MGIKLTNFTFTTFNENVNKTSQVFQAVDLSKFPAISGTDYYFIVCINHSGAFEIMKVIGVNGNTFTVYRAQEGTQPLEFNIGDIIELRITAGSLNAVVQETEIILPHADSNSANIGQATSQVYGHVRLANDLNAQAASDLGVAVTPYAVNTYFKEYLGAAHEHLFTSSQNWKVPVTGTYTVTCVGAGGNGGNCAPRVNDLCAGGAGGGGGAGETLIQDITLTGNTTISITVGAIPSGTSSFGTYMTARGGGNGENGSPYTSDINGCIPGNGGAAGVSYGTAATVGGLGGQTAGKGGVSVEGRYGNGGNGGTYGNAGKAGIQGCVKVKLKD